MQEHHLTFNQVRPGHPGAGRPARPETELAADAFRHAAAEAELLRVRLGQLQGRAGADRPAFEAA